MPPRKLNETIWGQIPDPDYDWLGPHQNEIEQMFAAAEAKPKEEKSDAGGEKVKKAAKPGSVSILDGKRSQNLSILLSRFGKATLEEIRDGIIKLDEAMFELGTLKALETFVPTDEEMEQIKDYLKTGDIKMLGKAEQFFVLIDPIPNLAERYKAFVYKLTFPLKMGEIKPDVETLIKATKQVKESKNFLKFMEVLLVVGNFINGGTFRGDCAGFRMDALIKTVDTKTADNKSHLLMYLAKLIRQKFPDAEKFLEELSAVTPAARVPLPQLTGDVALLKKDLAIVEKSIPKIKKKDKADPFKKVMKSFIAQSAIEFAELEKFFAESEEQFKVLVMLYGEDPKTTPEEFFTALGKFMAAYEKCVKELDKEKEALEKIKKREAAKAAKAAKPAAKKKEEPAGSATGEAVVDDLLTSVKEGGAFKARRAARPPGEKSGQGGNLAVAAEGLALLKERESKSVVVSDAS